jgi:uncharacterized protein YndB with AHSA1/START domain
MLPIDQTILEEIHFAVIIHTDRVRVYETLTHAEGWNAWLTEDSSLDPRPGGRVVFQWKNFGPDHLSTSDYGTVIEVVPPERFCFRWHPDSPTYETEVNLDLYEDADGTVVRVTERGFADSLEGLHAFGQSAAAWGEALTLLKYYLEHDITYRS